MVASGDGASALLAFAVLRDDEETVASVRTELAAAPEGLDAAVTGEVPVEVDADAVEQGLDLRLLAVTAGLVGVFLLLAYRSPVLWLLPAVALTVTFVLARAGIAALGTAGLDYSELAGKILTVLVFGVGTDYALLVISRHREELRRDGAAAAAAIRTMRGTAKPIAGSALTIAAGLACLTLSRVPETRGLAPVLALGVATTALVMATLLPALLAVTGRWVFWPRDPLRTADRARLWQAATAVVFRRPRSVAVVSVLVLLGLVQGVGTARWGLDATQQFRDRPQSIAGLDLLRAHFPAAPVAPAVILVRPADTDRVLAVLGGDDRVAGAEVVGATADRTVVEAHLVAAPFTAEAQTAVAALRATLGPDVLVGGTDAIALDVRTGAVRDLLVVGAAILLAVGVILLAYFRSVRYTAVLLSSIALTAAAAAGVTAVASRYLLGFAGIDPTIPLFAFLFVVAVGVDFSLFLVHRFEEERRSHPPAPALRAAMLATGSVITSAGLIVAATFGVLATLPLVPLAELGLAVAAGILLDTFVVRLFLVPAVLLCSAPPGPEHDPARPVGGLVEVA